MATTYRVFAVLFVTFFVARPAYAEDGQLAEIHALLAPMRAEKHEDPEMRGAAPALTTVKHRLRDWVEARLASLDRSAGGGAQ
jgi:hypothetical protein